MSKCTAENRILSKLYDNRLTTKKGYLVKDNRKEIRVIHKQMLIYAVNNYGYKERNLFTVESTYKEYDDANDYDFVIEFNKEGMIYLSGIFQDMEENKQTEEYRTEQLEASYMQLLKEANMSVEDGEVVVPIGLPIIKLNCK